MSGLEVAAAPAAAGAMGAGAGMGALGAGLGGATAAGLGTAGGLGLMGAAATPALSLAAAPVGASLASGALGAGIPAVGSTLAPMIAGTGGISTLGGVAPQLTADLVQTPWWQGILDEAGGGIGKIGKALDSPIGKMVQSQAGKKEKSPGQPAPALGAMAPRSGVDSGGAMGGSPEDQMNMILSRLFGGAQGA